MPISNIPAMSMSKRLRREQNRWEKAGNNYKSRSWSQLPTGA